jgi:hypothetical protein
MKLPMNKCQSGCSFHKASRTCYCPTTKRGTWAQTRAECLYRGGDAARQILNPRAAFIRFLMDELPLAASPDGTVSFYLHPDPIPGPEDARLPEVIKPDQPKFGALVHVDLAALKANAEEEGSRTLGKIKKNQIKNGENDVREQITDILFCPEGNYADAHNSFRLLAEESFSCCCPSRGDRLRRCDDKKGKH